MKPQVYVAGGKANLDMVRTAQAIVRELGGEVNFDWTDKLDWGMEQAAIAEIDAASSCDLLVVCFPAGRGTHCEIGAALAGRALRVLLFGWAPNAATPFYYHPKCRFAIHGMVEEIQRALAACAAAQNHERPTCEILKAPHPDDPAPEKVCGLLAAGFNAEGTAICQAHEDNDTLRIVRRIRSSNPGWLSFPLNGVEHSVLAAMFGKGDFCVGNGEWRDARFISILPTKTRGDVTAPVALPRTPEHDAIIANLRPEAPGIVLFFEKLADVARFEEALARTKWSFEKEEHVCDFEDGVCIYDLCGKTDGP